MKPDLWKILLFALSLFPIRELYAQSEKNLADDHQLVRNRMPVRPLPLMHQKQARLNPTRLPAVFSSMTTPSTKSAIKAKLLDFSAGSCQDTTKRLLIRNDTIAIYCGFIAKTKDGNFLIPAFYELLTVSQIVPLLIKCAPDGTVIWCQSYYGVGIYPDNAANPYLVQELVNGDILMIGEMEIPETVNGREELAVWRLNS